MKSLANATIIPTAAKMILADAQIISAAEIISAAAQLLFATAKVLINKRVKIKDDPPSAKGHSTLERSVGGRGVD